MAALLGPEPGDKYITHHTHTHTANTTLTSYTNVCVCVCVCVCVRVCDITSTGAVSNGTITLGGVDPSLYDGTIQYTKNTHNQFSMKLTQLTINGSTVAGAGTHTHTHIHSLIHSHSM